MDYQEQADIAATAEEKMPSTFKLVTFGCQMNKYDSEKMNGVLVSNGMSEVDLAEEADLILVNTCSIREKAENKVFSYIGRLAELKEKNKNLLIALGGCMATFNKKEIFRKAPGLDIVFGPDSISKIPELISQRLVSGRKQMDIGFSEEITWDSPEGLVRKSGVVAWIGIMKGCDNHCTYCVVPGTRGREISRHPDSIIGEVRDLAGKGYREICLIGQNVNSYGKGLTPEITFPELLRSVEEIDGVQRIRFMTSHPKDITDELIEEMAVSRKICPSLHMPLQSGSDSVLARMNRGYTVSEYLAKVERIRNAVEGISISTDLMVGFPGETEEDFLSTCEVMKRVRFDSLFLFNYSSRSGTPAAGYGEQVERKVSQERFDTALTLHKSIIAEKNLDMKGRKVVVLCEDTYNGNMKRHSADNSGFLSGRTRDNFMVVFKGARGLIGEEIELRIYGAAGYNLLGEPV
ncbi:MAG: tRNA (N6-isopentenyl adenosine(37)-C2)-methylthiotransferase MiaB [Nitrospinota bacterium]|nr:tRNA (N6-isopentenyl adenosine(37)-C2)-methylthiotransferase MiaB [Nitrospinota bacterium]